MFPDIAREIAWQTPVRWAGVQRSLVQQLDRAANNAGVTEIIALPELMRQNDYRLSLLSRRRIGGNQPSSHLGAAAPVIRCVRRNVHRLHIFRKISIRRG